MAKRKRLNIVSTIRNSESRAQSEEQPAASAQHHEQSQAQQSQQSEEVQEVVGEQSQPSSEDINHKKVRGATLMPDIWELPEGQRVNVKINNLYQHVGEESTAESNGTPPTRADVYVRSRTRKDGSIVNSRAAVVVERIQEKRNESSSSENLSQNSWSNDVFAQVKGPEKRGRVRCVGAVHTRSSQESGPSQSVQNTEEVEVLKSKVAKLEKLFETCFLPYFQQQRPDLHVPDMDALLRMVDTKATPDAGSASAPINCISPSLPSTNQQNTSGNDANRQ